MNIEEELAEIKSDLREIKTILKIFEKKLDLLTTNVDETIVVDCKKMRTT